MPGCSDSFLPGENRELGLAFLRFSSKGEFGISRISPQFLCSVRLSRVMATSRPLEPNSPQAHQRLVAN